MHFENSETPDEYGTILHYHGELARPNLDSNGSDQETGQSRTLNIGLVCFIARTQFAAQAPLPIKSRSAMHCHDIPFSFRKCCFHLLRLFCAGSIPPLSVCAASILPPATARLCLACFPCAPLLHGASQSCFPP